MSEVNALPLLTTRILVTRTREQASALSDRLSALGAIPVEFPAIRIVPPREWWQLDVALARLFAVPDYYSWLIFTSANAVRICCERLRTLGCAPSGIQGARIAAIGPATAAALAQYGLAAALVPGTYVAESVAAALIAESQQRGETLAGQHILLPRAAGARKVLTDLLAQAGALVDEIPAYVTLPAASGDEQSRAVLAMLRAGQLDVITFTSSSTVYSFMRWLSGSLAASSGREDGDESLAASFLRASISYSQKPLIACIGPITAQSVREHGLDAHIEAATFTTDGLVAAIVDYYQHVERTISRS